MKKEEVIKMIAEGKTVKEIAAAANCTPDYIHKIKRKQKLNLQKSKV